MNGALTARSGGAAYKSTTPGMIGGRNNNRRTSMAFSHFGKIAVAAAGLTLASLAASAPASAQGFYWGGGPRVDTVQYYGGGGGYGYRGEGWRRHHWGPRCFTERVVRPTPYGRRVI